MGLFIKKPKKGRAIFLYRCHDYNPIIEECYNNFMKNLDIFHNEADGPSSVELFIIGDNLHPEMEKRILNDHVEQKKYKFASTLIRVNSNEQEECLISGESCTPKHYTLYITSVNLCNSLKLKKNDIIFFLEDDYKFKNNAFSLCYHFASKFNDDFVSPFDHPDRYKKNSKEKEDMGRELFLKGKKFAIDYGGMGRNIDLAKKGYANYKLELVWEFNHHWRTAISICHSFACTYNALKKSEPYLYNADMQRGDHMMWTHIWGKGLSKLWSPVPGLARHIGHWSKTALLDDNSYDE